MAKKMITVKVDEPFNELLIKLAKSQDRSQGAQIQHMIKKECEKLGIKLEN